MASKPNGEQLIIREQIIEDPVTGLTLQFAHVPGSSAPHRLRIYGALPDGVREICFDEDGREGAAGVDFSNSCRPTWIKVV